MDAALRNQPVDRPPVSLWRHFYDCERTAEDLAGAMLVVAGAEDTEGAVWGQILSRAARGAGAVGAIVAGRVRDRAHLAGEGLPVWGAGEATVGAVGMAHVRAVGEPVVVAGVEVRPDDTLVVDDGGVVCLAAETAEQVLDDAHSYEEAEAALLADLSTGVKLADAYDRKRRVVQAAKQRGP